MIDPKNPGAVDEILIFGEFWNVEGFTVERDTIINFNKDVKGLFDSAITPDGLWDYIDTIIKDSYKCYFFEDLHTKGISEIFNTLAKEYVLKGYDVELYHQPLNPDRIQTVIFEKLEGKKDLISKDIEMKNMLLEEVYKSSPLNQHI